MEVKALQQMLTQFRQMQETIQRQIDSVQVEASAGGGMVVVKMNGQKLVNEASRRVDDALADHMKSLAGSMPGAGNLLKIPGLF
jgi:DNA-binding protein YbaB